MKMERRRALTAVASLPLLLWSGASAGQASTKVRRIGTLHSHAPADKATWRQVFADFVARLDALGWVEDRNLFIEHRSGEGDPARMRQGARELVRLNVELIVTTGTGPALAAKEATSQIPIVSLLGPDPVSVGLIKNTNDPARNVTGFYYYPMELVRKRLELMRELLPKIVRIALIYDEQNLPRRERFAEIARFGESFGMKIAFVGSTSSTEIDATIAKAVDGQAQALMIEGEGFWTDKRVEALITGANRRRLPLFVPSGDLVQRGALMALESDPDNEEFARAAAYLVDKILRGTQPADLPIQQVTRFALAINEKTATEIGVTIPQSIRARADHVYR